MKGRAEAGATALTLRSFSGEENSGVELETVSDSGWQSLNEMFSQGPVIVVLNLLFIWQVSLFAYYIAM